MSTLYKVDGNELIPVPRQGLAREELLEDWIARDPSIIGLDVLVLGRQVVTGFGKKIDILTLSRDGDLGVIELKRERTSRVIVGQILDYASWVSNLTTKQVHEIALDKLGGRLEAAYQERFGTPLPENLNSDHSMIIVASELDASSKRIVEYLAEEHGLNINTAFFNVFDDDGQQFLASDWLMDQEEVVARAESRQKLPWNGDYYVNAGHDPDVRSWEDMRKFGFISAGYGRYFSKRLDQLEKGSPIYAYHPGAGYIGFGIVQMPSVMSHEFKFPDGSTLEDVELVQPGVLHDPDDQEMTDYVVAVDWQNTVPIADAKTFTGAFANQNIVCMLRDPATLDFLAKNFGKAN